MNGIEAQAILLKPRFGHPVCLDAKHVLEMGDDLRLARKWARERGLGNYRCIQHPIVAEVPHEALEEELKHWRNCGWSEEQA